MEKTLLGLYAILSDLTKDFWSPHYQGKVCNVFWLNLVGKQLARLKRIQQ